MTTRIGLWIDHREATIVSTTASGNHVEQVLSKIESPLRDSNAGTLHGRSEPRVPADDRRQNVLTGHLNIYYDRVIDCIRDAESVLIFGPGEAKGELLKRLEYRALVALVDSVEPADKMTDKQIAAKVIKHYADRAATVRGATRTAV